MLAMDIDKGASKFFEHTQGAEAAVDVHSVATRSGEHAPKNQLRLVLTDDILQPQALNERMGVWKVEGGFELRLFFSGTDLVGRGSPAD